MTHPITQELERHADPDNSPTQKRYDRFLIDCARLYFHFSEPRRISADKAAELFDLDEARDGISLDAMYDRFREGCSPEEAVGCLPAN